MAATPKRGGSIRAGLAGGSTSDSLDPSTFIDTVMVSISRSFRSYLVDVGQDNNLQPSLAESWEPSADAKTWRFKLRNGVEFSNGKSITTDDVVASLNIHRGADATSGAKSLFTSVVDVKADGKDVIVVTLDGGNADFPYVLTDYHVPIMPSADGKADVHTDVGSGPYALESFQPGIRAELKRRANAWQGDSLGFFDEATVLVISDATARQNALLGGEVDVINRPENRLVKRMAGAPGIRVETVESNRHNEFAMQIDAAPFNNADFRSALKHALNRQEFVDKILYGFGTIGNDNPIGPGFRYHDASLPQTEFDLDKARSFIEKSGLKNQTINLSASDTAFTGAVDAAVLLSETAAKIGVNINVVREPEDAFWSSVWLNRPFVTSNWGSRPVEDMILSVAYMSNADWNESRIRLEQLDQLIVSARSELDEAKRKSQYSDIQQIITSQGGTMVPAFVQDVMLMNDKVATSGQYGGGWEMDGGHFINRWWAA